MSWRDMPAPSSGALAIDAVFAMAREYLGCMSTEDAAHYEDWLDQVRNCVVERQSSVGVPDDRDACSTCGQLGHKKTTCPLALSNIEVEQPSPPWSR